MGEIDKRKCTWDGYCLGLEFAAEDWESPSRFGEVFGEFIVVEREGRTYYRPKVPPRYCYFCGKQRDTERKISRVMTELESEIEEIEESLKKEINGAQQGLRRELLDEVNRIHGNFRQLQNDILKLDGKLRTLDITLTTLIFALAKRASRW